MFQDVSDALSCLCDVYVFGYGLIYGSPFSQSGFLLAPLPFRANRRGTVRLYRLVEHRVVFDENSSEKFDFECTFANCESRAYVKFDRHGALLERVDEANHNHPENRRYINPVADFTNGQLANWLLDRKYFIIDI